MPSSPGRVSTRRIASGDRTRSAVRAPTGTQRGAIVGLDADRHVAAEEPAEQGGHRHGNERTGPRVAAGRLVSQQVSRWPGLPGRLLGTSPTRPFVCELTWRPYLDNSSGKC